MSCRWNRKIVLLSLLFSAWISVAFANTPPGIYHLAPVSWFTGLKDSSLEIILNAENIDILEISMDDYPGVRFLGKSNSANRHIAYINLIISPSAKPGTLHFHTKPFTRRLRYVKPFRFTFNLLEAAPKPAPFKASDITYRIITDRFINGNPRNDRSSLKNSSDFNRGTPGGRHGGDIQGIINGLGYIKTLGFSRIWMDQIQECNNPELSYKALGITDHFQTDPRFGSNSQMEQLRGECEKLGIGLTMDFNLNQAGWFHWMFMNFDTGWFNNPDSSVHPLPDAAFMNYPFLSDTEKEWIASHWMDPYTPDFNQHNSHISRYLKQCLLWWTETSGVSAWVIPEPHLIEPGFLPELMKWLKTEYPNVAFIANTNCNSIFSQAAYTSPSACFAFDQITDHFTTNSLQAIAAADSCDPRFLASLFNEIAGLQTLSVPSARLPLQFNSQSGRPLAWCKGSLPRWEMITTLAFSLPGSPAILYGTETGLYDSTRPAYTDLDFNCLNNMQSCNTSATLAANPYYQFLSKTIRIRSENPALINGSTRFYAPADGIMIFFRKTDNNVVMVAINQNAHQHEIALHRFADELKSCNSVENLYSGAKTTISGNRETLSLPPHSTVLYKLIP